MRNKVDIISLQRTHNFKKHLFVFSVRPKGSALRRRTPVQLSDKVQGTPVQISGTLSSKSPGASISLSGQSVHLLSKSSRTNTSIKMSGTPGTSTQLPGKLLGTLTKTSLETSTQLPFKSSYLSEVTTQLQETTNNTPVDPLSQFSVFVDNRSSPRKKKYLLFLLIDCIICDH